MQASFKIAPKIQAYQKISNYAVLLRLNKPIGIFLLLWPTLIALWIAGNGHPDPSIVVIFVLGVILMRSAGCVINDMVDKRLDKSVSRTATRPLVTGKVSLKEARFLFTSLILIAAILVLQLNLFTILLACISLLFAMIYPFMKRITHLPQVILGMAFSMAIPMAFAAQLNSIPIVAWCLVLANILWVIAYDTQYAMVDREDDIKIGIKSTAVLFGHMERLIILTLQIAFLIILLMIGFSLKLKFFYYAGILGAAFFIFYQTILIRNREPVQCFQAFLNNNLVGASLFLGLSFSY